MSNPTAWLVTVTLPDGEQVDFLAPPAHSVQFLRNSEEGGDESSLYSGDLLVNAINSDLDAVLIGRFADWIAATAMPAPDAEAESAGPERETEGEIAARAFHQGWQACAEMGDKAEKITTVWELDLLPEGSIILPEDGAPRWKHDGTWCRLGARDGLATDYVAPARVLHFAGGDQ